MASIKLVNDDFSGAWLINSDPFQKEIITQYIDDYYDDYIQKIISVDAFSIITSLPNLTPKWNHLIYGVSSYYNERKKRNLSHKGVNRSMKGLLYFLITKDNFDSTNSKRVESSQEVSSNVESLRDNAFAASRWNRAVNELNANILPFIKNYEVITKDVITSNEMAGVYTLEIENTLYLDENDVVTIDGVEYIATNVTANTFDIIAESGKDFTGETVKYEPYKDFPLYQSLCYELTSVII